MRPVATHQSFRALGLLVLAAPALAQTPVDPNHKFAWSENCGFLNWADSGSPAGAQGVRSNGTFLSGFIWAENIGYINVGDGSPVSGSAYANATGDDAGVNILASNDLAGFAWGENVGWINFSTAALAAQRARFDAPTSRLRGYAWGENIGWINLDDANIYVGLGSPCYANCDLSTIAPILNVNDFACFINRFQAGDPYANCDNSTTPPVLNVQDFACYLNRFAAGCP
jgi:hypothetical protein